MATAESITSSPALPTDRQRGTTLVELAVLMTAAALLLAGVLTGVISHAGQRRVHNERTLAMAACRNTLESLRSLNAASLAALHGTGFDVPGTAGQPHGLQVVAGDADGLPGEISVTVDRNVGGQIVHLVRTRVRWRGATRNQEYAIETRMVERR